jgi:hypothetical protein
VDSEQLRGGFALEASTPDGYTYGLLATPANSVSPYVVVKVDPDGTRSRSRSAHSIDHGRRIIDDLIAAHRAFANVPPHRRARVAR